MKGNCLLPTRVAGQEDSLPSGQQGALATGDTFRRWQLLPGKQDEVGWSGRAPEEVSF